MTVESVTTEEGELPTERSPEVEGVTIWFRIHGLLDRWFESLKSIRDDPQRGPRDYAPPDVEELEDLIRRIARDHEPGVRIINTKGSGTPSWQNKLILGVCTILAASGIIGSIANYAVVASIKTMIEEYKQSTNARLDRDEREIDDTQRRLDRGAGMQ